MDEGDNPFAGVEMEGGAYGGDDNTFEEDDALLEEGATGTKNSGKEAERPTGLCGCLTVQYYQPYFDVDTEDVKERLVRSLQGYKFHDFVSFTDMKPDLYGPFWLCTTLIFTIGATANFASYLSFTPTVDKPRWNYDFTLLTGAAAVIYGFSAGIPGVEIRTIFNDLLPRDDPFVKIFFDHRNFGNPLEHLKGQRIGFIGAVQSKRPNHA